MNDSILYSAYAITAFLFVLVACAALENWLDK